MTVVFKSGKELEVEQGIIERIFKNEIGNAANQFQIFKTAEDNPIWLVINTCDISHIKASKSTQ